MEKKIQIWEAKDPGRSFHYNPAVNGVENEVGSNFLNVYQEDWQKMLLRRYGNTMRLLDATYRTTKYALQFFMLVVKTNVHYVPEDETAENTQNAIGIQNGTQAM